MMSNPAFKKLPILQLINSRLPNFEISWAGECPLNQGFCLGSEDGHILFVSEELHPDPESWRDIAGSGEPINGVAFSNGRMVVSTPGEVIILEAPKSGDDKHWKFATHEGGAHGVRATVSGGFIAPLGKNGLLAIEPRGGKLQTWKTIGVNSKQFYFYSAESLASTDTGNVHVCAVRRDGLATVVDNGTTGYTSLRPFPGSDIIDVCSIANLDLPLAAIALGIDRSLHFVRDVLQNQPPKTLKFKGWHGKAYRVFHAQGHVILLTSERIYVLKDLVLRFLSGQRIDVPTTTVEIPIQAVDASLAFGRWLLIVMPDGLRCVDTQHWAQADIEVMTPDQTPELSYDWEPQSQYPLEFATV